MHGHDFWVLAAETGVFDGDTSRFNTANPSRHDGLALEFVESQSRIRPDDRSTRVYRETCDSWMAWTPIWDQEDSGI
ncbi:hypothetical protein VTG60DRAFT_1727 [Thermothelomyces hinnuleus]